MSEAARNHSDAEAEQQDLSRTPVGCLLGPARTIPRSSVFRKGAERLSSLTNLKPTLDELQRHREMLA